MPGWTSATSPSARSMTKVTKNCTGAARRPRNAWRPLNSSGRSSMATIRLPHDFKEFLQLLNSEGVKYLLVGGYAVAYYGYARATGDMDVWVAPEPRNAAKILEVLRRFGFGEAVASPDLFLKEDQVVRMGVPPMRIELLTTISGV